MQIGKYSEILAIDQEPTRFLASPYMIQPGSHRAIDVDFSPNLGCSAGLGYMEFTGSAWGSPMASQATPAGELKFEIGGKRWVGQPYIINYSNGLEAFFAPANVELVNSILAGEIIHAQLNNRLAPIEWPPAANGAIASQQAKNICIQDLVQ